MFGTTTILAQIVGTYVTLLPFGKKYPSYSSSATVECGLPCGNQAAISRSFSRTPLRKVEKASPQRWAVVLFPRLSQFPPARLGEVRRRRMQSINLEIRHMILELSQDLLYCLPFPHRLSLESAESITLRSIGRSWTLRHHHEPTSFSHVHDTFLFITLLLIGHTTDTIINRGRQFLLTQLIRIHLPGPPRRCSLSG